MIQRSIAAIACLAICTIILIGPAAAQGSWKDAAPAPITLHQALTQALQHNHEYKIAAMNLRQARERVNAVWGQLVPFIESEASVLRQGAESGFMSLSDGQYDLKVLQFKFGINPGAFYQSLRQAHAGMSIAREEVKKARAHVEFTVIRAYCDVLLAEETLLMRRSSLQSLEENLKDVTGLYHTGSVPRFELLQGQLRLRGQEPLLREAENNLQTALDYFNLHLGNEETRNTVAPSAAMDVRDPRKGWAESELVAMAMIHRPEVIQVTLQQEAADRARKAHQSWHLWPFLSVAGHYGFSYLLPNEVDMSFPGGLSPDFSAITGKREWQQTWQVRVAATYRWSALLPVDSQRALEREQKEKTREAEERLTQLRRLTAISVRALYGRLCTAYESVLSQRKNLETAEEGLRIARESYRAGVIKNAEILSAELALTGARTAYIKGLYDYHVNTAELDRETGVRSADILFRENEP